MGRRVIARDTHTVDLTEDGNLLLGFASRIADAYTRLDRFICGNEHWGCVRFGVTEDFVMSGLTEAIEAFAATHPKVDLQVTVGLSLNLYRLFDDGQLDVIFVKRREGDPRGKLVWRDRLIWVGHRDYISVPEKPLPLIVFPPPSVSRTIAIRRLEGAGVTWRVACVSTSLSGIYAALHAKLGVTAHAKRLCPQKLVEIPSSDIYPDLGEVDFVVIATAGRRDATSALTDAILRIASESRTG